jgi:hypothetical protein
VDSTGYDAIARILAYGHPALMFFALVLAGLALRAGLGMRRARLGVAPRQPGLLQLHLQLAKPAVALLLVGFVGGPVSAVLLRDWSPFESLHAWLGVAAALLFLATGWLGHSLARGRVKGERAEAARRHGLLAAFAMLVGATAAVAGMVLLP